MTTWPDLFTRWHEAPNQANAYAVIEEARRFVAQPQPERWAWLSEALRDPKQRYFVAYVFERQPVPKALRAPMLEAAIATDASSCRVFLRPLLGTFGQEEVRAELERYELAEQEKDKLEYWLTDRVESRR